MDPIESRMQYAVFSENNQKAQQSGPALPRQIVPARTAGDLKSCKKHAGIDFWRHLPAAQHGQRPTPRNGYAKGLKPQKKDAAGVNRRRNITNPAAGRQRQASKPEERARGRLAETFRLSRQTRWLRPAVRSGQIRSDQVGSGQVRSGQVRSGQVRSGRGYKADQRESGASPLPGPTSAHGEASESVQLGRTYRTGCASRSGAATGRRLALRRAADSLVVGCQRLFPLHKGGQRGFLQRTLQRL